MFKWLRKSGGVPLDRLAGALGWMGWGSASGVPVSTATSLDVTAVFCAARVIAEGVAQMPVCVVRETFDDRRQRPRLQKVPDHPVTRLLARRPNGWQTGYEFREGMVFCAALAGGAIAIKNVVRDEVRELLPVPPGCWTVEQMSDWDLRIRVNYGDKTSDVFPLSRVFYLRGPALDGFKAIPAVQAAREAIGLSVVLERQQARLAANGGKPSGVLSFEGKVSPDFVDRLRDTWQSRFGPGGEGGIAILDNGATFHPITMKSVDAEYLATRRMQIEEIARAFRVLPIMMMQADKASTYASAEQMFRMHVIHTLGPWIERFEQAANRDLIGRAEDEDDGALRVDLDERNLLRGDFKDQAEYYTKALGAGGQPAWMTQNEIRAEVGLNPIDEPWADTLSRGAMTPAVTEPGGNGDGEA